MQYIPGIKELLQIIVLKLTAFSYPVCLFMYTAITLRITLFKWRLWTESLKNLVLSGQFFFFFNMLWERRWYKRGGAGGGSEIRRRLAILVLSEERKTDCLAWRPTDVSDNNFIDFVPYFDWCVWEKLKRDWVRFFFFFFFFFEKCVLC